jgi:hypothetical protein
LITPWLVLGHDTRDATEGLGVERPYSAEGDGSLLGRLALKEVQKRSKPAVWIVGRFAILEAADLERDFFKMDFRVPAGAIAF